jgi:DNA repair protein RadA/Sms
MVKSKIIYSCSKCGSQFPKWSGQCDECGAWNSIAEEALAAASHPRQVQLSKFTGKAAQVKTLAEVKLEKTPRFLTGSTELDRVLGGGLVIGSVVLIGGDPGIGKSTLLLQSMTNMSQGNALYVSGEESLQQITLRAKRLGLPEDSLKLLADTNVERIIAVSQKEKPKIIVIDSIQTMFTESLQSAPGAVGQVRESAAQLVQYAKHTGTALFIVGHVTKEGTIAGPRVLEHMVDTVLYFEGDRSSRFRVIRAVKNRFGAVNELGIFAMTDKGLREVNNPSAIFLSRYEKPVSGSAVMVAWEGSRPLLVEVQALVDESHLANPRRVTVGLEYNRLSMLLAILHRHASVPTYNQDVFVNVVGGIRVLETAADLPIVLSIISSLKNRPFPADLIVFGEVGLAGEIRPVQNGQERLYEAVKHGFKRAIVPKANAPKKGQIKGLEIIPVQSLSEALAGGN